MLVNEKVNFDHNGPGGWAEDECLIGQPKPRSIKVVCHRGECSKKFCRHG